MYSLDSSAPQWHFHVKAQVAWDTVATISTKDAPHRIGGIYCSKYFEYDVTRSSF